MRKTLSWAIICLVSFVFSGAVGLPMPPVEWTPRKLAETVRRGEAKTVRVVFTAETPLEDISVVIVPELEPYVSAEPASFDAVAAGQTIELAVTLAAEPESPLESFEGTLRLRSAGAPGRGTFAKPLPIELAIEEAALYEEFGSWNMPDPAVTGFTVEPERADPGDAIALHATVANEGTGALGSPDVLFFLDDEEIARIPLGPLGPDQERTITADWTAEAPGRHVYRVELSLEDGDFDRTATNNTRIAVAFSSGEAVPTPDLALEEIDFAQMQLTPSEPVSIPLTIRNPSFATITDLPLFYSIDGLRISPPGGDRINLPNAVITLAPGEQEDLTIPWIDVTPGEHLITVEMGLPDDFPEVEAKGVRSWCAIVPDKTVLYTSPLKNQWASIGPRSITGAPNWPHTHFGDGDNVGRVDRLAFDPDNPAVMYAAAPTGGLWKTTNGGASWAPLGDKWPSMRVGSVAVDPKRRQIVYAGTGSARGGGAGIFKSTDGGQTWHIFASKAVAAGVSELVVRYTSTNQVLLYAGTERGVLRYTSSDPYATTSAPSEWTLLKKTQVLSDMVVHPTDNSIVYVSVSKRAHSPRVGRTIDAFEGIYRTRNADAAVDETDAQWVLLDTGLPTAPGSTEPHDHPSLVKIDIFEKDPDVLYAGVVRPFGGDGEIGVDLPFLGIYHTNQEGDVWSLRELVFPSNGFLDFLRVHPSDPQILYYGGVHFFTQNYHLGGAPKAIEGVHDDVKSVEFDPATSSTGYDHYYVLTDGGIWRCKVAETPGCVSKNRDLRVTMFYDIDPSPTSAHALVGGTQDSGTLLYQGSADWKIIRGGDGNFSEMASDQVLYSQNQGFKSTGRCENGASCGWTDWKPANQGLPDRGMQHAQFAAHPDPARPKTLASQGDEVYYTTTGGGMWDKRGPKGATLEPAGAKVKGSVTRVLMGEDFIIAGTSTGQIWHTALTGTTWRRLYEHPGSGWVNSLSLAPVPAGVPPVLFVALTSSDPNQRAIVRLERDPFDALVWTAENITRDFPVANCSPNVVSADGFTVNKAYVGTESGVYRGQFNGSFWFWRPFNDGLPLVEIRDLVLGSNKDLRAATFGRGAWSVVTGPDIN